MPSNLPAPKIHLRTPPEPGKKASARTYLIYVMPGNPGLIEYYRTYMTHLYGVLSRGGATDRSVEYQVYGRSFSGFEAGEHELSANTNKYHGYPPYGLQDQIRHAEDDVTDLVEELVDYGAKDVRVILVGHSVGGYVALEVIRRLRAHGIVGEDYATRIVGGVALFPTVAEIAKSESGMKAAPFLKHSKFATIASIFVGFWTFFIPLSFLAALVKWLLAFPADAARTTAAFIKSPIGVQQALHMARDEMFQIDTDFWDDEVWGAATPSEHKHARATLRFLFAKKDHWVADETRDRLIQARARGYGSEAWKPVMEVDETGEWPHGFCLKHSVPVAERTAQYVAEIVAADVQEE